MLFNSAGFLFVLVGGKRYGSVGRRALLWVGIVAHLGLLGYFKHAGAGGFSCASAGLHECDDRGRGST